MDKEILQKYASIVAKFGGSIKSGDEVLIAAEVGSAEFVTAVAEAAYKMGARKVTPLFYSETLSRVKYLSETEDALADIPDWIVRQKEEAVSKDAVYISIVSEDPEAYRGVDQKKIAAYLRALRGKTKKFRDATMNNTIRWTIAAYPSEKWAQKIFPGDKNAYEKLTALIIKVMRLDAPDVEAAWETHQQNLTRRIKFMNGNDFKALKYKNSLGTDLYVELPENYTFLGGRERSRGRAFMANLPTEEIFSAPYKYGVEGKLVASMPLVHNGDKVEHFEFTFLKGKIVDFKAEKGYDILKHIIETDEGSRYLGEIALVPYDSPIQNLKTIFYETLFDENASCHFAIGKGYPCVKDAETATAEDLIKRGINDSLEHVDFMVGSKDLSIVGIKKDGTEVEVFKDGNFVIG